MSMTMKAGSAIQLEPGSWQEAAHDVYMGVLVGLGHMVRVFFLNPYEALFGSETVPEVTDKGELKVVGVGFGRTGTYSLKLALDQLGMPTLHTQHLYETGNEPIFKMWIEKIFKPSIASGKAELGEPDFDIIANNGYQATMDFPAALYWEQVLEQYPDTKFILTVRENSQTWYRSWETLSTSISAPAHLCGIFLEDVQRYSIYLRWLFALVNKDDSYITSTVPKVLQDREAAIASYEEHNRRVREMIPADRLLEYSVKEGWEPLCEFLEIAECPTTPFPKTNSARSIKVQGVTSAVVPLGLLLFVIFYMFAKAFERVTGRTVMQWLQVQTRAVPRNIRRMMIGNDKQYQAAYMNHKVHQS